MDIFAYLHFMSELSQLHVSVLALLKQLIATPSFSREEGETASLIFDFLQGQGLRPRRQGHNVWLPCDDFQAGRPTLLLNSHHDTVKPAKGWSHDPFQPTTGPDGRLIGLGSNDAGGPLMTLLAGFLYLNRHPELRDYNLILAATAEEEISGKNGIAALLPELGSIDLGVVGEPTGMQLGIAEKGLMVLDVEAEGRSGHAAREEGLNAIYEALPDINWFRSFRFERVSPFLGPVKMSVTQIEAGTQHNVVPASCRMVVDVRTNELYSNREVLEIIQGQVKARVEARSLRLNSSRLDPDHAIVRRGEALGLKAFGSPTLSDQALMPFPSLKIGPGDSARSHSPDEYIFPAEIEEGIYLLVKLLEKLKLKQ
jgi:acetylornithine deacetylase